MASAAVAVAGCSGTAGTSVAFALDAEARQRDLEKEFPGVGAVAVSVDHTMAAFEALADRIDRELPPILEPQGFDVHVAGVDRYRGRAFLKSVVLTEDLRGEIERRFSGEPLCVDGLDPATVPPPGPQPSGGDGWRLLADEAEAGALWKIGLVADAVGLEKLWAEVGLDAPVPEVDFEENVVIWFGSVVTSSCHDVRLDDVVVEGPVVRAELVDPVPQFECTADAVPHAFVVALERSRLPSGMFTIRMTDDVWWSGAWSGASGSSGAESWVQLRVNADLSEPAAVVEPGAVLSGPPQALPRR